MGSSRKSEKLLQTLFSLSHGTFPPYYESVQIGIIQTEKSLKYHISKKKQRWSIKTAFSSSDSLMALWWSLTENIGSEMGSLLGDG